MKKLLVILLTLIMLLSVLPGSASASAAEDTVNTEDVGITPFVMVNWDKADPQFTNVSFLPFFWVNPDFEAGDEIRVSWGGYDINTMAARLKTEMDSRPEGMRFITYTGPQSVYRRVNDTVIYLETGTQMVRQWLEKFLKVYHEIGGKLDGIALDLEYRETAAYYLHHEQFAGDTKNTFIYNEIVEHPLYQSKLRPLLEERGFEFYPNPSKYTPEIFSICLDSGSKYESSRQIWNAVMHDWKAQYLNEAVYEPLMQYYPDALVSDYDTASNYAWLKTPGDHGYEGNAGGNVHMAGNCSNIYTYAGRPSLNFFKEEGDYPPAYNKAVFEDNAFNAFLWDTNRTKNVYAALDGGKFSAWITYYDYRIGGAAKAENTVSGTPYHTETILHIGLLNPEPFLGYILASEIATETKTYDRAEYDKRIQNISQILDELTRVVGASDRKPILVPSTWNSDFVLSGMYAGGRNVWRISPDTTHGVSLEEFQVEGADPTFYISGQTVTFPGGKIIENGKIEPYGSCGYWVETPVDVVPIITNDPDRYSNYPAYMENFEGYQVGDTYNYQTAQPESGWEINMKAKQGGSALIQADADNLQNKVLALTGTGKLRNVKVPQKISAGDNYAKQQLWQVTVTVPEGMDAAAELVLLSCSTKDGGFKVQDGKLWYGEGEEYKQFQGVDLSAGGKYTLKRELDFRNEESYTSSYYVYNAAGELVASAKDVSMVNVSLPVEGISITCEGITGAPVLIDDYKLNAAGVTTDFEVYGADLGLLVDDPAQPSEEDLAYRFSWMNATQQDKTYAVVAAYYNSKNRLVSEKIVETVQMSPNSDGVLTGIVDTTDDMSVRVYLKEGADLGSNTKIIIIAVLAALVLISVAVWGYFLYLKKRNKNP